MGLSLYHPAASHYSHFISTFLFYRTCDIRVGARGHTEQNGCERSSGPYTVDTRCECGHSTTGRVGSQICMFVLTMRTFHLLITFSGCRPRRNPDSQVLCWIFCRANKTMPFNFLVWKPRHSSRLSTQSHFIHLQHCG